jgi:hypothetical protein
VTFYMTVAEMDAEGHAPNEPCKMTKPYEVGRMTWGTFERAVDMARMVGVTASIEEHRGGILVKRGLLHVQGRWEGVRTLLVALEELEEDLR